MSKLSRPKGVTLATLIEKYAEEGSAVEYLEQLRWPDGPVCPKCSAKTISTIGTRGIFECSRCSYQFTVRVGTVLQDSKLPLWKWMIATFLMVESKKGISANQLRRFVGVSYKTAWFLTHRIREAMFMAAPIGPLGGVVEMDETFVGGKPRHRRSKPGPDPLRPKTMVLGAVSRGGEVRLRMDRRQRTAAALREFVEAHIDADATHIYTDAAPAYGDLSDHDTRHESVNHTANEWVRGDVHTNNIEGVWSLFKRSLIGSYHHLSVKHMDSYLGEIAWRFNNRRNDFLFRDTMRALLDTETMTYKQLTERPA